MSTCSPRIIAGMLPAATPIALWQDPIDIFGFIFPPLQLEEAPGWTPSAKAAAPAGLATWFIVAEEIEGPLREAISTLPKALRHS